MKSNSTENIISDASTANRKLSTTANENFDLFSYLSLDEETKSQLFGNNQIDHKLDAMVKDWFTSHDILYCIHPSDGSILIWLVDWLDEYLPGNFRQAQVSFHAKLPNSIPVGDAMSLTNGVFLYTEPIKLDTEENYSNDGATVDTSNLTDSNDELLNTSGSNNTKSLNNQSEDNYYFLPGVVNLVSKHNNGTLNLWRLQFNETSKYQSLVNVSHVFRTCGHRFRVSDITSHPVLPFLLTNSMMEVAVGNDTNNFNDTSDPEQISKRSDFSIDEAGNQEGKELLETFHKGFFYSDLKN
jgi:hypothetical protein